MDINTTTCLNYSVLTCVNGCSWYHICLSNTVLTCVQLCFWYHICLSYTVLTCVQLCFWYHICLSYTVLTCVQLCFWYHICLSYTVLTCVQLCFWYHHLSELSFVHLCPGRFMTSLSVWAMLCLLVPREVHSIAICLSYHLFTCDQDGS
jgi:hypothetical protein